MPVKSRTEFAASSLDSHVDITRTKNKTRNSTNQRLFYLCQMRQIFITGATGNIGTEVIRSLIILGTRNNIGDVISILLEDFDLHKNKEIELTGVENLDFYSVAEIMSSEINDNIEFVNVNLLKFFRIIKQDGLNSGLIIVMTMLHFLPRLQSDPTISNNYETLIGNKPTALKEFVYRERFNWNAL